MPEVARSGPSEPSAASPPVPAGVSAAWTAGAILALATYFFFVHSFTRGLLADVGLSPGVAAKSLVVLAVMAGFILWLAPVADLPAILYRHRIPERRIARGECPGCGQRQDAGATRCPECGDPLRPPPKWELSLGSFARFSLLCVAAIALGGGLAEWRTSVDEAAFRAEAATRPDLPYTRPRAWPADFARLDYDPAAGLRSSSVTESPQIPGWKPKPATR